MFRQLICPNGHRWQVVETEAEGPGGVLCPVCAAPHVTIIGDDFRGRDVPQVNLQTLNLEPDSEPSSVTPPEIPPTIERVLIPGYEVQGLLGRGGMGVVYKARHLALKRTVALKMILAGSHANPEHLHRFRIEAEAVARLHHPNIVQIHDVGEHEGLPYFSLEFVDGESLDKRLHGTLLSQRPAAQLVETLARAIQYAHERGVVHRDLKPANVLLAACGLAEGAKPQAAENIPKITDFGLAKQLDVDSGHTQSGSIVGTPSYMAPEQATGRTREIGPLSDVWALGAILYELLTGRPPFKGASVLETLEQVRSQDPVPPHRLQPKVPRDLETICLKCLQKDQRRRYASAGELADDLHCFLTGEPIEARPTPAWERIVKWGQRYPALASLIGLSAVALVALLGVWGGFTVQLRSERDRADQQRLVAEDRERTARRLLYAAHVNLAQRAWSEVQVPRMIELLTVYRQPETTDLRGLEWHYLWRLAHSELFIGRGHTGNVRTIAFSPDGRRFVSGGEDRTARVWDMTQTLVKPMVLESLAEIRCAAFSPDGRQLATATGGPSLSGNYHEIYFWGAETGQPLFRLQGHKGGIAGLAFNPDGKSLASASADRTVIIWDLATRKARYKLTGHLQSVQGLAFNPKGDRLATVSLDRRLRLWDALEGKELKIVAESEGPLHCVAWSQDGKTIAAAGGSQLQPFGEVRLWDAETGTALATLRGHGGPVLALAFHGTDSLLASASKDGTARLWDTSHGRLLRTFRGHSCPVWAVAFRTHSDVLATAGSDGTFRFWDVTGHREEVVLAHENTVSALAFSADNQHLAVAASGNIIDVWPAFGGIRPLKVLEGHTAKVQTVAFGPLSAGAGFLASGGDDQTINLWELSTGRIVRTLRGHSGSVRGLAFSSDGRWLASCDTDQIIKIWQVDNGQESQTLTGHAGPVYAIAFSPDGQRLASAGADQTVRLWNLAKGREVYQWNDPTGGFKTVAFSPDGLRVAAGQERGLVRIWDAATGDEVMVLRGHSSEVNGLAFSPDGQRLATGSDDQTVRLWDTVTGQEVLTLTSGTSGTDNWISSVAFSPDGKRLAAGGADRKVRIWLGDDSSVP